MVQILGERDGHHSADVHPSLIIDRLRQPRDDTDNAAGKNNY